MLFVAGASVALFSLLLGVVLVLLIVALGAFALLRAIGEHEANVEAWASHDHMRLHRH